MGISELLNVLRPPLILGYTGSMRMIDADEVGLKERPEDTMCSEPRQGGKKQRQLLVKERPEDTMCSEPRQGGKKQRQLLVTV